MAAGLARAASMPEGGGHLAGGDADPTAPADAGPIARLDLYRPTGFERGRPLWIEALWQVAQTIMLAVPGSALRRAMLRLFGARIGRGVVVKAGVRVTFPWRLTVGDHSWIGENAWIDNLGEVRVGSHCCISQGVYLCTGNHDWQRPGFDLIVRPIIVEDGAWIAARACVGPGVTVGRGAILALGSVAVHDLAGGGIHQGCPAKLVRARWPATARTG